MIQVASEGLLYNLEKEFDRIGSCQKPMNLVRQSWRQKRKTATEIDDIMTCKAANKTLPHTAGLYRIRQVTSIHDM